jgi:aerobic-type carbon monoxide dehydrogenase small subunit (CoxS/CutS family)
MIMKETVQFELNGKPESFSLETDMTLMWVLRTDFGLTGSKFGCGVGLCGSCTVLVDHEPVRSCQVPMSYVQGKKVLTIEGLSENGTLHPIQEAFARHDALQCGYCTPGMIMNAFGLLLKNPEPTREEIISAMENNLCRCGTYGRIIEAIQTAAAKMKGRVAV